MFFRGLFAAQIEQLTFAIGEANIRTIEIESGDFDDVAAAVTVESGLIGDDDLVLVADL